MTDRDLEGHPFVKESELANIRRLAEEFRAAHKLLQDTPRSTLEWANNCCVDSDDEEERSWAVPAQAVVIGRWAAARDKEVRLIRALEAADRLWYNNDVRNALASAAGIDYDTLIAIRFDGRSLVDPLVAPCPRHGGSV